MPICHKCRQQKDDSSIRTYHLVLKNNTNRNSFLARMDKVNICFSCDSTRTTTIVKFLEQ